MSNTNRIDAPMAPGDLVKALVDIKFQLNTLSDAVCDIRYCVEDGHNPEYLRYRLLASTLTASALLGRLVQMQIILEGKE